MSRCVTEVTRPDRSRSTAESGVALITVLTFLMVIAGLGSALLLIGRSHSAQLDLDQDRLGALEAAQAGIVQSTFEIGRGLDLDPIAGIGNVAGQILETSYSVVATPLGRRHWRIDAEGTSGGLIRHLEVVIAPIPTGPFRQAIAGTKSVTIDGGVTTDSYDSLLGTYSSQANQWDVIGRFAGTKGSLTSNEALSLSESSTRIRGDARPGPGETVTGDGFATVTGDTTPLQVPINRPPRPRTEFGQVFANNDNALVTSLPGVVYDPVMMSVTLTSGSTVIFAPGEYFFTSMTLEPGARAEFLGSTSLYLVDHLDASSGTIASATGNAQDLSIFAHPYDNLPLIHLAPRPLRLELSGSPETALTIHAPGADIEVVGGSDLFGALIGKQVVLGGGVAFHYDEALGFSASLTYQPHVPVAWRDRDPVHGLPAELGWASPY